MKNMKVQTNMSWDVAWMYLQLQHFSQFWEVGSSRLAQWRRTLECQTQFWLQVWSAIRLRLSAAWIHATCLPRASKNPLYTVALRHVTTCMSADRFWIRCVPLSVASAVCRAAMEWCGLSSDPDTEDVQPHSTPAGFCEDGNLAILPGDCCNSQPWIPRLYLTDKFSDNSQYLSHATCLQRDPSNHTFGLSGYVIAWIRSYLTDRSSFVKIDSSSSPCTTILTGMPQGSVLGPLLFVLFISPIANVINSDQSNQNSIVSNSKSVCWHGFIKGVVVFQVDWGMLLISAAEGVWMVTLLR